MNNNKMHFATVFLLFLYNSNYLAHFLKKKKKLTALSHNFSYKMYSKDLLRGSGSNTVKCKNLSI